MHNCNNQHLHLTVLTGTHEEVLIGVLLKCSDTISGVWMCSVVFRSAQILSLVCEVLRCNHCVVPDPQLNLLEICGKLDINIVP